MSRQLACVGMVKENIEEQEGSKDNPEKENFGREEHIKKCWPQRSW